MTFEIDMVQAEDDLRCNLREAGLVPPDGLDGSGKLVRLDAVDKPGKKTGWLVYHLARLFDKAHLVRAKAQHVVGRGTNRAPCPA
jgi:hypothetical protein